VQIARKMIARIGENENYGTTYSGVIAREKNDRGDP
jgi:hypothetical protein